MNETIYDDIILWALWLSEKNHISIIPIIRKYTYSIFYEFLKFDITIYYNIIIII